MNFFAWFYDWGVTSDYRFKIGDFAPTGPVYSKFWPPPTILFLRKKNKINDLSYGIKICTDFFPFSHNSHVWQTDGRTDRILIARPRLYFMQRGKNLGFYGFYKKKLLKPAEFREITRDNGHYKDKNIHTWYTHSPATSFYSHVQTIA